MYDRDYIKNLRETRGTLDTGLGSNRNMLVTMSAEDHCMAQV